MKRSIVSLGIIAGLGLNGYISSLFGAGLYEFGPPMTVRWMFFLTGLFSASIVFFCCEGARQWIEERKRRAAQQ